MIVEVEIFSKEIRMLNDQPFRTLEEIAGKVCVLFRGIAAPADEYVVGLVRVLGERHAFRIKVETEEHKDAIRALVGKGVPQAFTVLSERGELRLFGVPAAVRKDTTE